MKQINKDKLCFLFFNMHTINFIKT